MRFKCLYLFFFVSPLFLSCTNIDKKVKGRLGQNNAIWSESIYLRGYNPTTKRKLTEQDIKKYALTLKKYNIRYAYLFAGPYGADGHVPDYAFSATAIHTVSRIKAYYPDLIVLPWLGGIQYKTVHLEDSSWVNTALQDTKKLVEALGVPGVHVDMEFIQAQQDRSEAITGMANQGGVNVYADNVNLFHQKLRKLLPEAFISSVVVATSPDTQPWKRKTTLNELKHLVNNIDQLSFLFFDTHISKQDVFEKNALALVQDIRELSKVSDIQYLVAIGTFVNIPELREYRDLNIENIPNTIRTLKQAVSLVDSQQTIVDGLSIYCDWQTDDLEWEQFSKHWAKVP